MSRRALLIAYHFPPIQGSSGVHRTVAFARYLREFGWDVSVLTVHPRVYLSGRSENADLIPGDINVHRAFACDAQRDFSIGGRYLRMLELPDRWQSWIITGTLAGLRAIRKDGVTALFSTFPIASAHAIGWCLHRLTGLPWCADFRDPMAQTDYPADPRVRWCFTKIERAVFRRAAAVTVTTPTTAQNYARKYPHFPPARIKVINNGYDEETFRGLEPVNDGQAQARNGPLVLLHSGILYPMERNPGALFAAMGELKREGQLSAARLRVRLRASGSDEQYRKDAEAAGVADMVELAPPVDYRSAVEEMWKVDGLIACQSRLCDEQIPAKVYEYLYTRKPVLGLANPGGDTGKLLSSVGFAHIAALEDAAAIKRCLLEFVTALERNECRTPSADTVRPFSRREGARELARVFDEITGGVPPTAAH